MTARASREVGGDELPARIASRTLKRVLRRVAVKAPARSTGMTTQLATRMCQGFAAIVGEPISVSALGAARRGASSIPSVKPRAAAIKPRTGGLECEDGADLARGEAGRLQQPDLTVLSGGARADEDPDHDEGDDQEQDGERRHDDLDGLCIAERKSRWACQVSKERSAVCNVVAARSVNAAVAAGFASRSASVQRQLGAIGLDAFEHGRGDPGQAGVTARVARLAGYDRRPEHGEVDRAAPARHCKRVADVDAERIRKAAFEHDPVLTQ